MRNKPFDYRGLVVFLTGLVLQLGTPAALAKLQVVTTLPSLGALAAEIGGDRVQVTVLVSPGEDPHYLDPRPNIVLTLSNADLVVVNGLELEVGWLPKLLVSARNPEIQVGAQRYIDASTVVSKLEVGAAGLDRRGGDIHVAGNPHYLYDPRNGARIAVHLAERLTIIDPDGAASYSANARRTASALTTFAADQIRRFLSLEASKRKVVTYHRSLSYLTDWLQLTTVGTIEPKPGIAPDPGHVATILSAMKAQQCRTIVHEKYYPGTTGTTLAKLTGANVIVFSGGPNVAAQQTYLNHLQDLTDRLYASFVTQ